MEQVKQEVSIDLKTDVKKNCLTIVYKIHPFLLKKSVGTGDSGGDGNSAFVIYVPGNRKIKAFIIYAVDRVYLWVEPAYQSIRSAGIYLKIFEISLI